MLPERFWSKVRKTETCWLWTGHLNWFGYGLWHPQKGRQLRAHRVMYESEVGPIPAGRFICHRCDNPPCVRPDHLFVGTQKDNIRDAAAKGRRAPQVGEQNHGSKLTEANVRTIRQLAADGLRHEDIAVRFAMSRQNVYMILRGKSWSHVA